MEERGLDSVADFALNDNYDTVCYYLVLYYYYRQMLQHYLSVSARLYCIVQIFFIIFS